MRPAAVLTVLALLLLVGCGGSGGGDKTVADKEGDSTLEEIWRSPGDDVVIVAGTATHEPGSVRVSFLVVDAEGRVVTLPTAQVWVARKLDAVPFLRGEAKLERIGVPGGAEADATHLYVSRLRLDRPGTYWLLAQPEGGATSVQALGNVIVGESPVPDVGEPAVASDTPTIASTGGDFSKLTTETPPDEALLRHSVADSLRAKVPFVVTFATPEYCSSRTCGPVVDVVASVAERYEDENVRFIHVEVYEDNDPAKGFNPWMQEWSLSTEPWTFLVGADGLIVDRFEGAVSVLELEEAIDSVLATG
jgi:hypothetical protein